MRIIFTWSGRDRKSNERIIALIETLFPVPVEPAVNKCGIFWRSETTIFPVMSLPNARGSL